MTEDGAQARLAADAVARRSSGKLVAFLAARTRDVASAEDALSEAFASALSDWPVRGCPSNPEAWLLTVARRKMIDAARRRSTGEAASGQLQLLAEGLEAAAADAELPDRRLALMFACAHPAIDAGVRTPLMLQAVVGLDAKAIASALLTSPAAMGKRLGRAKSKIRDAGIPFRVPDREELPARLDSVLDAIYAAFAQGWTDPGGTDVARRGLSEEARLQRSPPALRDRVSWSGLFSRASILEVRNLRKSIAWTVSLIALASTGQTQEPKPQHVILEGEPTWGEGPPALPKGAMMAVVSGDPGKPGPYTLRAKMPAGYKIPPHWHPTDENVTVISGTVAFGMGDKFVAADMKDVPVGGYALMPATMRHYFTAKTAAVIQVHGSGPFTLTYVNPADDPRQAPSTK